MPTANSTEELATNAIVQRRSLRRSPGVTNAHS